MHVRVNLLETMTLFLVATSDNLLENAFLFMVRFDSLEFWVGLIFSNLLYTH